ncbi:multidrug resistance protein MdtA [Geobacter sp. OR-1]|uniref:efflux RND transporter periplasmic adaptor subunit n=1 Tax=Geobacter sp. OR-1 TaxID=1266765 RepID=UPI000542F4AF|nr:efflux RND transporter periplasmic adaptor subunit [Geobacter sp. OR-1]GAM09715.1 multidrug resistance protein MdtA [Geobacter sp. OR-1]
MMMRVLPFIVATVMAISGCSGGRQEELPRTGATVAVKGVKLEQVLLGEIPERLEAVGTVVAVNSAVVAVRVAGTITAMTVREGDRVTKGQVLAVLEANEALANASAAAAGVEEAGRALEEAKSRKRLADATFLRYQKLYTEQAVTRQEYDNRKTEQEVAEQGVLRAESRLVQARESSRGAAVVSGYTRVTAPMSGVVTVKSVDRGTTVFPGMPIATLEADSGYRLHVQVPESLKGRVASGQQVEIALDGQQPRLAAVAEVVPVVDPASRTFTAKIAVSGNGLRSGIYGRAYFPLGKTGGMLVPKMAVLERGTLTSVWVVDSGNIARMRLVKPGRAIGDKVEILSGLSAGERVVVAGTEKVTDGAKVE